MNEDELMLEQGQEMPPMDNEMPMEEGMPQMPMEEEIPMGEEMPMEQEQPLRGRGAAMERWREANEGAEGEPEDDDLYDFALGQADEMKGKYDSQNEVNSAFANRISQDPKLAALITGVMEDKNPAYVLAKLYGKDFMDDEDSLEAMQDGYAEYLEGVTQNKEQGEQAQANFLESMKKVDAYAEANGMGEEVVEELRMELVQAADDILTGVFSDSFIETVAKGLSHDADVQEAADTGFVEGKNEKVEMKYGRGEGEGMPSMGNASNSLREPVAKEAPKKSFFDEMKAVE